MEENNVQQEPVYLNYGADARVDQNKFLSNAANNLTSYLAKQPWSSKKKQKFVAAYQDIMSNGITGASNADGMWNIQYNGTIDLDSLSKKDREIYGEAAYYIQQQMDAIHEDNVKEEKKKEDLPLFDNAYFNQQFQALIGNKEFGGTNWSKQEDWNTLDEADENGIRKTTNRAKLLAKYLRMYSDSLKDEYNWEGSPFSDLNDLKTRINNAILALESEDPNDDKGALNKIGLRAKDYLSTGADDIIQDSEGNQMTRQQYIDAKNKMQAEANAAQAQADIDSRNAARQQELANRFKRISFSKVGMYGQNPEALATKYGSDERLMAALTDFSSKESLNGNDWSTIVGAYKFYNKQGKLQNLTPEEIKRFAGFRQYQNISPGTLKKLPGVEGFYFDSRTGQVIKPLLDGMSGGDSLAQYSPEAKQQKYLQNTEWTSADTAELVGIAADIASIVDPEPFSAAGLGFGAAVARNVARAQQPQSWGLSDYLSQGLDYITGVIGAIPGVGDAALAAKVVKNLRKLGRVGAWMDVISTSPEIANIWSKKIMGDEKMTVQDWKALGTFIRGLATHGRLNQSNLAVRKVMKESGIKVDKGDVKGIRENLAKYSQKYGFTTTKPTASASSKTTIKIKDENGTEIELPITLKTKQDLEGQFKGKTNKEKIEIVKKNIDVQDAAKKSNVDLNKITGLGAKSDIRNIPGVRKVVGTNRGIFGEKVQTIPSQRGVDNFENYLKTRSNWDKIKYGTNNYLRSIRRGLGIATPPGNQPSQMLRLPYYQQRATVSQNTSGTTQQVLQLPHYSQHTTVPQRVRIQDIPYAEEIQAEAVIPSSYNRLARRNVSYYNKVINNAINGKSTKDIKFNKAGNASGEITINGNKIKFSFTKGGNELSIDNNGTATIRKINPFFANEEVKRLVANTIKTARNTARVNARSNKIKNDTNFQNLIKEIKKLKRTGFLQKGGYVDKPVDIIISEFLNKNK